MPEGSTQSQVLDRVDLQGGKRNNAYVFRNAQRGGRWSLYFFNPETKSRHRFVLKHPNGRFPDPTPAGLDEALELAQERYIELRTRSDRGEAVNTLTIAEMVDQFLKQEHRRISSTPHEGITDGRFRLIRNQTKHFLNFCTRQGGCGSAKQVHLFRRSYLETYQQWRQETTDAVDKQGRILPRPTTLNGEFSTIRRMFREVALAQGFINRDQLPDIPNAKVPKDQSFRRSALSADEWVQLEKTARLYWTEGLTRFSKEGKPLGFHKITKGENKGKNSTRPITRNSLYGVNKGKSTKKSTRAQIQQDHRQMLYLAMRISMESGIRIGSLRKMRWGHISQNKTLSNEDQKVWCLIEVPPENTKTGRWYEVSAPIVRHLERLRQITRQTKKTDLLFINQKTGDPLSDRIWGDGLKEMLVEAGLANWSEDDSNNCRKIDVARGKTLTWYSFRHTWITFALERGVPIATVCNNCDTSIQYIQEHYFHYDAKRATGSLSKGRARSPKGGLNTDWMKDPYVNDNE